jgi:hypothetical protein
MESRKILVKDGDIAIITCPFCQKVRKLSVEKYKKTGKRNIKIRCNCETIFHTNLEFRRYPRKSIRLIGDCVNISKNRVHKNIIINNISYGGIGFNFFNGYDIARNDQLKVSFNLNNAAQTHIDTQVTVQTANDKYVGCEFNSNDQFKQDLGFYLIT